MNTKPRYTRCLQRKDAIIFSTQWGLAVCRPRPEALQIVLKRRSGGKVATYSLRRHPRHGYLTLWGWHPKFGVRDVTFCEAKIHERVGQIASAKLSLPEAGEGLGVRTQAAQLERDIEELLGSWITNELGHKLELPIGIQNTVAIAALPNLNIKIRGNKLKASPARRAFREPELQASLEMLFGIGDKINRRLRALVIGLIGAGKDAQDFLGAMSLASVLLKRHRFDPNLVCNYVEGINWQDILSYRTGSHWAIWESQSELIPMLRNRYNDQTVIRLIQGQGEIIHINDSIRMLNEIGTNAVMDQLPPQPNWRKLHDLFSDTHDRLKTKYQAFEYPDQAIKLDGLVLPSGRKFVLPKSNHELKKWGRHFGNCVGSYASAVLSNRSLIIGIMNNDLLTEVTEWHLKPKLRCVQAETFYATDRNYEWCEELRHEAQVALEATK